ncbi:unnamed protein product [Pieris macdunnoughi]|uniref:Uncharacterized protein n=1 Tax=Pieris macdunnoughi TaxID=345717 RepID=A0A821XUA2_9NEOP|nr:unnamed protein product [Pieris macdunnoughi]
MRRCHLFSRGWYWSGFPNSVEVTWLKQVGSGRTHSIRIYRVRQTAGGKTRPEVSHQFLKKKKTSIPGTKTLIAAKKIVHSLRVVNDLAERGVALMEEYNKLMTTNEEQKKYWLLLVKE